MAPHALGSSPLGKPKNVTPSSPLVPTAPSFNPQPHSLQLIRAATPVVNAVADIALGANAPQSMSTSAPPPAATQALRTGPSSAVVGDCTLGRAA
mmetsp:Transcript_15749/g.44218  ORF Transcript_15749/g.44218 Transcript_15749/m.44218 type:complete len:95 (+) Transcript_15749:5823-6107(+)|eukprot:scaffold120550_cov28-Tisochrysis_lutea.AAC.6